MKWQLRAKLSACVIWWTYEEACDRWLNHVGDSCSKIEGLFKAHCVMPCITMNEPICVATTPKCMSIV